MTKATVLRECEPEVDGKYLMCNDGKTRYVEIVQYGRLLFWQSDIVGGSLDEAKAAGRKFFGPLSLEAQQ